MKIQLNNDMELYLDNIQDGRGMCQVKLIDSSDKEVVSEWEINEQEIVEMVTMSKDFDPVKDVLEEVKKRVSANKIDIEYDERDEAYNIAIGHVLNDINRVEEEYGYE